MKARLTKTFCLECLPRDPAKGEKFWDSQGTGLLVRVTPRRPDGSYGRYFAFYYRTRQIDADGRPRRARERMYQLGPVGRWTLAQARDRVAQLNARVAEGGDPVAERQRSRAEQDAAKTVEVLARLHMERHHDSSLEGNGRRDSKYVREDRSRWRRLVLPEWGDRLVGEITAENAESLIAPIRKERPTAANRLRAMLSKAFSLAEIWGMRPKDSNPFAVVIKAKEQRRERVLTEAELADLLRCLDRLLAETGGSDDPSELSLHRQLLVIALLAETGMRPKEALGLQWDWVCWERRILDLPRAKRRPTGRRVGLSIGAIEILRRAEKASDGSPWVFPSPRGGGHLTTVRRGWATLTDRVGFENKPEVYTLRHTFVTLSDGLVGLGAAQSQAGHADIRTTARYFHSDDVQLRETADKLGQRLTQLRRGTDARPPRSDGQDRADDLAPGMLWPDP